ncbi:hypothetical protein FGO68_gene4395 [Halteria grandinella]|uniref:Hexose transporter 1 n=1 Tax=Halteria grandinella TaxID=5974 RepID=A0A8J8T3D3_HALGN|nr:hypothetical protein FGO68_gene4395 [Halteria grandinella]
MSDIDSIYIRSRLTSMVLSVAMGALAVGYNTGVVSCGLLFMDQVYEDVTTASKIRFVSYAILAGTIGASGAGIFSNYFGRRFTIIISDLFLIAGPIVMSIAIGTISLIFGRLIVGVGIGTNMMMGPMFLQEGSPLGVRSKFQPTYFCAYFVGLILSYLSGIFFPGKLFPIFAVAVIPAIVQIVLMAFTQNDPPLYLAKRGALIQADKFLKLMFSFNGEESNNEYARNRQELVQAQKSGAQAEKSILQCAYQLIANYRWNLFVGCMLHLLQQFSGFTLVQYYGVQILRDAGFSDASNSLVLGCMVLVSVVMLVGNIVCIQVSERYGRRQLVLYCTMPMAVAMLGLTFCVAVNVFSETPGSFKLGGWIGLIALCVFMAFCSVGFATQPWTLCQEIFPAYLKNMAITITNLVSWACNYAIASWYLSMTDGQMGKCIMYSIMGISSLAAFGFCFRYLPETKDLPLDKAVELVKYAQYVPASGNGNGGVGDDEVELDEEEYEEMISGRKNKGKRQGAIQMSEQQQPKRKQFGTGRQG